jgi:hypothetical protein
MMADEQVPDITLEDVRAAAKQLGGARYANATRIRQTLGHGSFTTIQKHLDSLRHNEMKKGLEDGIQGKAPRVPNVLHDVTRSLWASAWALAEQHHAKALADAFDTIRRLNDELSAAKADILVLTKQLDEAVKQQKGDQHDKA